MHIPSALAHVVAVSWLLLAATSTECKTVLVLFANDRLLPANIEVDRGLRETLTNAPNRSTELHFEFLDEPAFSVQSFEATVATYLREKYSTRSPEVVVAVGEGALRFLLRHRPPLFDGVPVVHLGVDKSFVQSTQSVPADIVGVPVVYDFQGTIQLALRWHPSVQRLVVVTGASPRDRELESQVRNAIARLEIRPIVEHLAALPTEAVVKRLSELGQRDVVVTPGYFKDGEGRTFSPRDSAAIMAAASGAPVYGIYSTFIGTGVVGGSMVTFDEMGRQAGKVVNDLLDGASPGALGLPASVPPIVQVDWRQTQRWGIDANAVPPDAIVHFREPSFWQAHRGVVLITAGVVVLQALLIAALLVQLRRRREAEQSAQLHASEAAHASRLAVAGELVASIAHEINQPLGAILSNAEAADLLVQSGEDRGDLLRHILADIRRDDVRASEVIRRLRELLAKHEVEKKTVDLNASVIEVCALLQVEATRRRATIEKRFAAMATVDGDRIQIQQVLINLLLNAMDAVVDVGDERRTIIVSVERAEHRIQISVRDRGHGIAPSELPKVFGSFYSTKAQGMGLGLSIARTIIEAHDGRIRVESRPGEGAAFYVDLPEAKSTVRTERTVGAP